MPGFIPGSRSRELAECQPTEGREPEGLAVRKLPKNRGVPRPGAVVRHRPRKATNRNVANHGTENGRRNGRADSYRRSRLTRGADWWIGEAARTPGVMVPFVKNDRVTRNGGRTEASPLTRS